MRLDCEIISQDFLPVLRAALAKELASNGMSQKEVADVLGISQPAISQYLRDLRGRVGGPNHFASDVELQGRVKDVCSRIRTKAVSEGQLKSELYDICERALTKTRAS